MSLRFFAIALLWLTVAHAAPKKEDPIPKTAWESAFLKLKDRLKADGVDKSVIEGLEAKHFEPGEDAINAKMFDWLKLSGGSFVGYVSQKSVRKVKVFLAQKDHKVALEKARFETGVPPEIVASILFIETLYRKYRPRFKALSALASLAALSDPQFRSQWLKFAERTRKQDFAAFPPEVWDLRAQNVGSDWYDQLKAFAELSSKLNWKPQNIRSSWAGAIGYGQFMPITAQRNMMRLGTFWKADLWDWDDTIILVARHVQENGWNAMATDEQKHEAIRLYNGRSAYADAVLKISDLLQKPRSKNPKPVDPVVVPAK